MKSRKPEQKTPSELRKRAEEILKTKITPPKVMSDKDTRQLIHELQVHQIQMEIQNDELRKAQAELEESRAKYSDLYDFAPVGYFTFDNQGLILEANLTAVRELGIERSLLINKPFRVYIVTEDREIFDQHRQKVFKSDDQQTCEIRLKNNKDGSGFYAQLESKRDRDSFGNNICRTSLINITDRKQAEKEFKISETNYRRLFETAQNGILLLDGDTGQITDVNPFLINMLGYSREDFIGKKPWDIGPFKNIETNKDEFKVLQTKEYIRYEYLPLETKDGRQIYVDFTSN